MVNFILELVINKFYLQVINEDNVKIKPFFTLINELCSTDKSLKKYKKYFKTILYKKFGIPEYETLINTTENQYQNDRTEYVDPKNKWFIEEIGVKK